MFCHIIGTNTTESNGKPEDVEQQCFKLGNASNIFEISVEVVQHIAWIIAIPGLSVSNTSISINLAYRTVSVSGNRGQENVFTKKRPHLNDEKVRLLSCLWPASKSVRM